MPFEAEAQAIEPAYTQLLYYPVCPHVLTLQGPFPPAFRCGTECRRSLWEKPIRLIVMVVNEKTASGAEIAAAKPSFRRLDTSIVQCVTDPMACHPKAVRRNAQQQREDTQGVQHVFPQPQNTGHSEYPTT